MKIEEQLAEITHLLRLLVAEKGVSATTKRRKRTKVVPKPVNVTDEERQHVRDIARKKGLKLL